MPLSSDELARYRRHTLLPEVGVAGQEAFAAARVAIVGTGGLGAPAALYLAAAGVGTLGLIDQDTVDLTNLQRQILYRQADVGRPKLHAARYTLAGINPHVELVLHETWLTRDNALEILGGYDIVLNGTDNFPTRYLVNDACVLLGKPLVDGSLYRFDGQVTVYDTARGGPCYRCRFPEPPAPNTVPSCAEAGVLGVVPGIVGCMQAAETLKLILREAGADMVEPLVGRLLVLDVLAMDVSEFRYDRDPACPVCGDHPSVTELIDYDAFCRGRADADDVIARIQRDPRAFEIEPSALAERLRAGDDIALIDVREQHEWDHSRIDGATLVPLSEFEARLAEVPADREVVTYCHHGMRSLAAAARLIQAGHARVKSLAGGIDAWSREVDPSVPRY